jgi:hypothetical protein
MATGQSCKGGGGSKGGRQMFTCRTELSSSGGNKLVFMKGGGCVLFSFSFSTKDLVDPSRCKWYTFDMFKYRILVHFVLEQ